MATVEQQTSSPQFGGQTRPAALTSEDMLTQGREMALQGVPLQIGGLLSALSQLRARASGSTAANHVDSASLAGDRWSAKRVTY